MQSIVVDDTLSQELVKDANGDGVDLVNRWGVVIGRFTVDPEFKKLRYPDCPFSAEELNRRSQETGRITWAEVKQRLGVDK